MADKSAYFDWPVCTNHLAKDDDLPRRKSKGLLENRMVLVAADREAPGAL